jgi:hypothetical protein
MTPPKWHNREILPRCECLTDRRFFCVRPSRVTMARGEQVKRACSAHALVLQRDGWLRLPEPIPWAF